MATEAHNDRRKFRRPNRLPFCFIVWLAVTLSLSLLHVLSSGPAMSMVQVAKITATITPQESLESSTRRTTSISHHGFTATHPVSQHPEESAAICAIAVNEEAYLDEWVDYNYGLGFSTLYIYDNSATHELQQWADEKGPHVVVKHYPGENQQVSAYLDCARTFAVNHTWAAFFDVDEFLVLRKHRHVVDFLHDHAPTGAVGVNWFIFYTSGRSHYQPLPVTQRFVQREDAANQHVKCIARVEDINTTQHMVNPHVCFLKNGRTIDTSGQPFEGPFNPDGPTDVAVLHHYLSKSHKEFVSKKMRGRADIVGSTLKQADAEALADSLPPGSTFDDSAWQVLKEVAPKYRVFGTYEGWRQD